MKNLEWKRNLEWMKFYAIGVNEHRLIGISPEGEIFDNCDLRSCNLFSFDYQGRIFAITIAKLLLCQPDIFRRMNLYVVGVNGSGGWDVFSGEVIKYPIDLFKSSEDRHD